MKSEVIPRQWRGHTIRHRADEYISATDMAKAYGKFWNDYWRLNQTQAFLEALALNTGIPVFDLVEVRVGRNGGTFVHPDIGVQFAMWLDPAFAIQVSRWVRELMTRGFVAIAPPGSIVESLRIDEKIARFQCELDVRHPCRWAVVTESVLMIFTIERELLRIGFPFDKKDLLDGSIAAYWKRYRAGKPWAGPVVKDCRLETANKYPNGDPVWCQSLLYRIEERVHFAAARGHWAVNVFGSYLLSKIARDEETWRSQGLQVPPLPILGRAIHAACGQIAGRDAYLPEPFFAALPGPGSSKT